MLKNENKSRWVHYRRLGKKCLCGKETPRDLHGGKRFDAQQVTQKYEAVTCKHCMHEIILRQNSGIQAVQALIDESEGVAGLHLNGDVATWEDLLDGWLSDYDIAKRI